MARSIGDHGLKGIVAVPEVTVTPLTEADTCLVVASDGVWEFLSSQEVVNVCFAHRHDATEACREVIKMASEAWAKKQGCYRDDITAIVVFLPVLEDLRAGATTSRPSSQRDKGRFTSPPKPLPPALKHVKTEKS
eukprot:CAMPEP_0119396492 /NCGR_PEP_ID=MMETSP1334-20130426/137196_1 /TAXON_ID=127549 /ORGANISM="Calcidiscus leptoporus, Strain RCC1130" /LENGTH=134 /DNA_ID=CAMNT_0007420169 /DNA_START=1 /DNA_END=401 /DNA_ORIENTATION=+